MHRGVLQVLVMTFERRGMGGRKSLVAVGVFVVVMGKRAQNVSAFWN